MLSVRSDLFVYLRCKLLRVKDVAQWYLPSMCEALSSTPRATKEWSISSVIEKVMLKLWGSYVKVTMNAKLFFSLSTFFLHMFWGHFILLRCLTKFKILISSFKLKNLVFFIYFYSCWWIVMVFVLMLRVPFFMWYVFFPGVAIYDVIYFLFIY